MIIVADIGNTFLKIAQWDGQRLTGYVRVRHREVPVKEWQSSLTEIAAVESRGVYVASVGRHDVANALGSWLAQNGHESPVLLAATHEACGVRNAYTNPESLGVDRWCAMVAARKQHAGSVCVIDVGTAMTVDWVDASGQHRGGAIMPGPTLQAEALFSGTANLREAAVLPDEFFADNTADAVVAGSCYACAAVAGLAAKLIVRESGDAPKIFLTGGEAERIMPLLETEVVFQPDLVLRGVICLAEEFAG